MPIIATILSGLFFWGVYWFIFMDGHKAVGNMLTGRRNAKRRAAALDAQARAPIASIVDPRDAATVLMYLVARQKAATLLPEELQRDAARRAPPASE